MDTPPAMLGFKPFGTPLRNLETVTLLLEEYESIRLADYEDLNQEEAAVRMGVSRPTFTRIYEQARKTMAKALAESKVIAIAGGHVTFEKDWFKCKKCDETFVSKSSGKDNCENCDSDDLMKLGEKVGDELDPVFQGKKFCYCDDCGVEVSHKPGVPCFSVNCPYCGQPMRGNASKA